jgi:hypothetical protein
VKFRTPPPVTVHHHAHLIAAVVDETPQRIVATAVLGLYGWSIAWRDDRHRMRQNLYPNRYWAQDALLTLARHRVLVGRAEGRP